MLEDVMAGSYRCMCGKHCPGCNDLQRAGKVKTFQCAFPTAFQDLKGRVPFIDVPYRWLDSQGAQCTYTTDAEHDFLLYAGVLVTTVKLVGNDAIMFLVLLQITVQQIQAYVSGLRAPDVQINLAIGEIDLDQQRLAVFVNGLGNGQVMKVGGRVMRYLAAVLVNCLVEIALTVENTDGNEGDAQVAGCLAVIAGENTQAA